MNSSIIPYLKILCPHMGLLPRLGPRPPPSKSGAAFNSASAASVMLAIVFFFFIVWARAGVDQPFDYLVIQNRQCQVMRSMGRTMDWTIKDNMVKGLFFCSTLTSCGRGDTPLIQGCSGAGTRGNGVPTPFSCFALKWIWSCFKMASFLGAFHTFLLALHHCISRSRNVRHWCGSG